MSGLNSIDQLVDNLTMANNENLADQQTADNDVAALRRMDIEQECKIANVHAKANDLKEKLFTVRSLCSRDRERPVGKEGTGVEERGLAWKRRDCSGREGVGVEEGGLARKRGDSSGRRSWRGREGVGVEERGLAWKRGSWRGRGELEWKRGYWCGREGHVLKKRDHERT